MSFREQFVAKYGEPQAAAIERAAESHMNGVHDDDGGEHFLWAVLICVGFECMSKYATSHGITVPIDEVRAMAVSGDVFATYGGDYDYLGALAGSYDDWRPQEAPDGL